MVGELLENLKLLVRSLGSCRCGCRCRRCCRSRGASRRAASVFRIGQLILAVSLEAARADALVVAVEVITVRVCYAGMRSAGALENILERNKIFLSPR